MQQFILVNILTDMVSALLIIYNWYICIFTNVVNNFTPADVSGQLTKMAKLKGSLTIALIFIAAVVGYSPRFCASVFDLLQIGVPVQLSAASNIAIAFWPISNSLIYCFRNKEIFTVVFGGSDGKPKRTRAHTWPGSERLEANF